MIRGLDDDEVDFLDVIDKAKSVAERKQHQEELTELQDYRLKVASMLEKNQDQVCCADSPNEGQLYDFLGSAFDMLIRYNPTIAAPKKSNNPKLRSDD